MQICVQQFIAHTVVIYRRNYMSEKHVFCIYFSKVFAVGKIFFLSFAHQGSIYLNKNKNSNIK